MPPVLVGHTGSVVNASFDADGRRVLTASWDETARVWDPSEPTPHATVLAGHTGPIWIASFSPDGRRVVTASSDGTARIWDLSGPTPWATVLVGHTAPVWSASFSADGQRVVTVSADQTAVIYPVPFGSELYSLARQSLTRCLTIAQRETFGFPDQGGNSFDRNTLRAPPC